MRALRRFKNISEIESIIVGYKSTKPIFIRDLAKVVKSPKEPYAYFKSNGKRAVVIYVNPKSNVNVKKVIDQVKSRIRTFMNEVDKDADVFEFLDPSSFINNALRNVILAVFSGMLIAGSVIFLFFGSFRTSILICLAMPLSLGFGVILMKLYGISINLLSLGGMALAVGMVVDGAVVVIENIERHFENNKNKLTRLDLTVHAVKEVFPSLVASVVTTIVVFFPLTLTSPIAEAVLGDLARVIIAVMLMSLLVSLIYIPRFSLSMSRREKKRKNILVRWFNRLIDKSLYFYIRILNFLLESKKRQYYLLSFMFTLFLLSLWLCLNKLPRIILSEPRSDIIMINLDFKEEGLDFFEKSDLASPLEQRITNNYSDKVRRVFSRYSRKRTTIYALLSDVNLFDELTERFKSDIRDTIDYEVNIEGWAPTSLEIPNPPDFILSVSEESDEKQRNLLVEIDEVLKDVAGVQSTRPKPSNSKVSSYIFSFYESRLQQFEKYRRQMIDISSISNLVSYYIEEQSVGQASLGGELRDIKIKIDGQVLHEIEDVNNILIRIDNKLVPLRNLVEVKEQKGWRQFQTLNGRIAYRLEIRAKKDVPAEILKTKLLDALANKGIDSKNISIRSGKTEIDMTLRSLVFALICSVILVYLVVVFQFNKISTASYVLVAIPLGFIGVVFSLMLFSFPLSINSLLGMILLSGTAVNNSIIFIDFYQTTKNILPPLKMRS